MGMNGRSLTLDDRLRIEQLINRNICNAYIARAIGRVSSVVHYEVKNAGGREGYTAQKAHDIANRVLQGREGAMPRTQKVLKDLKERSRVVESTSIKEQVKQLVDQLQSITDNLGKLYDYIPGDTA